MTEVLDLRTALRIVNSTETAAGTLRVGLACSFTPLHLETYLSAYLRRARPGAAVTIETGPYADLGTILRALSDVTIDACAIMIEWRDLDPRLGVRETVSAKLTDVEDLLRTATDRAERIARGVLVLAERMPVAVTFPVLPMPPAYATGRTGKSVLQAQLELVLAGIAGRMTEHRNVAVLRSGSIDIDLAAEIRAGFPYSSHDASALARDLATALTPLPAKKGLITDLDDTLWRGLVGEVGPESVTWDLDAGSHVHALYQQLLAALLREGVLVAAVSKNDPDGVTKALERPDLLVPGRQIFPVLASWGVKSRAVTQVLEMWNIAAADVVFVDDNPLELAEVARRHPDITVRQFPTHQAAEVWTLLTELRRLFPHDRLATEDLLRLASTRANVAMNRERGEAEDAIAFLSDLQGTITISEDVVASARPRELVNKTNQFSMNGARYGESEWREQCERPNSVTCAVSYADRFGPLGVISVLIGVVTGPVLDVDCWVLSCRAFSRGIEAQVLLSLFEKFEVDAAILQVRETKRNHVALDFIRSVGTAVDDETVRVERATLVALRGVRVHRVLFDPERNARRDRNPT